MAENTYVSDELTHFVGRGREPAGQYRLLVHILSNGWLTHPPHLQAESGRNLQLAPGDPVREAKIA